MGIFSRRKKATAQPVEQETVEYTPEQPVQPAVAEPTAPAFEPLDAEGGLGQLVALMRSKGQGQLALELKQTGNDMNLGFFENDDEKESAVVVPGSEWFDAVAAFYTEEEKSERGAFNRALIKTGASENSLVELSLLPSSGNESHNLTFGSGTDSEIDSVESHDSEVLAGYEAVEGETSEAVKGESSAVSSGAVATGAGSAAAGAGVAADSVDNSVEDSSESTDRFSRIGSRLNSEESAKSQESFSDIAFGKKAEETEPQADGQGISVDSAEETEAAEASTTAEVAEEKPQYVTEADLPTAEEAIAARQAREAEKAQNVAPVVASADTEERVELADNIESADFDEEPSDELPEHVEDDFSDDSFNVAAVPNPGASASALPFAATGAGAATGVAAASSSSETTAPATATESAPAETAAPAAQPAPVSAGSTDVPQNAEAYDVAPSFSKPAQPVAKPSTTAKAEGNLVLTEAEVVSRLAGAQEALFGPNGSARDVSTVLIRIRSLGSYYDALTHVRSGGFWDQKKTFELIPEDVLNVLQLKADSYQEGFGSPLAISLRFTPGIPPVASFDYSNEEAFVQYSDHLPAQQYVEELRMFPRTGSNIPEHMNQALTSWSF